jgi:hypothetical protein
MGYFLSFDLPRHDGAAGTSAGGPDQTDSGLDDPDVLGFLALATRGHVELDALTLIEGLVTRPLDVGEVDEHVVALLTGDEAEALLVVEELHGSSCHDFLPICIASKSD